jgi:hypothetical protein
MSVYIAKNIKDGFRCLRMSNNRTFSMAGTLAVRSARLK